MTPNAELMALVLSDIWGETHTADGWDQIRGWLHGASLVTELNSEAHDNLLMLRDVAKQHWIDCI